MELNRKALKRGARDAMRETRPRPELVTLVYLLLTSGLTTLVGLFAADPMMDYMTYVQMGYSQDIALSMALSGRGLGLSVFLDILIALFSLVLSLGYSAWALRRARGEEAGFHTLLTGFPMAGRAIGLSLFIALFSALWGMAVMIPAAILMAVIFVALGDALLVAGLLAVLVYVAALVLLVIIVLRYSLADYALLDAPDRGIRAAVNRSKALMRGRKGFYFVMHLSFFGWYLLAGLLGGVSVVLGVCVTVAASGGGAGLSWSAIQSAIAAGGAAITLLGFVLPLLLQVWLVPYIALTDAGFYQAVVEQEQAAPPPSFPEL
jgi:uncharacterized membrane protein